MNNENEGEAPVPSEPVISAPATISLKAKSTRSDLIDDFVNSFDVLAFLLIASCYYYDNLSLLLVARTLSQLQAAANGVRPVLVANVICFATHLLRVPTKPAKGARGYLNGSVIVDFVGEFPASRLHLLLIDLLIFAVQLLPVVLRHEKEAGAYKQKEDVTQDLDAEEAGISRSNPQPDESEEGIEMQSMLDVREEVAPARDDDSNSITLRPETFRNAMRIIPVAGEGGDSADAVRRFIARVEAVRNRRAQLVNAGNTS